jgi:PncC family amidohydrolase
MDEARELLAACGARRWTLAVAESDTGGLVLEALTALPGSSAVVLGGVVAYADSLKRSLLGISPDLLQTYGAVSAQTAAAMAHAVRERSGADLGLATTGIAGPGGATPTKPVGLAYVAAATARGSQVKEYHWPGERAENRAASARATLRLALQMLAQKS